MSTWPQHIDAIKQREYGAIRERIARLPEDQWQRWLETARVTERYLRSLLRADPKQDQTMKAAIAGNDAEVARVITLREELKARGTTFEEPEDVHTERG